MKIVLRINIMSKRNERPQMIFTLRGRISPSLSFFSAKVRPMNHAKSKISLCSDDITSQYVNVRSYLAQRNLSFDPATSSSLQVHLKSFSRSHVSTFQVRLKYT